MTDAMTFPKTLDEFMEQYTILDTEQVYTNGTALVPIFRIKQWEDAHRRKTGQWIKMPECCGDDVSGFIDNHFSCSECKKEAEINSWGFYILSDFCPHCGADMRGEEK